jgi:lambda family phage tail tape measure protein
MENRAKELDSLGFKMKELANLQRDLAQNEKRGVGDARQRDGTSDLDAQRARVANLRAEVDALRGAAMKTFRDGEKDLGSFAGVFPDAKSIDEVTASFKNATSIRKKGVQELVDINKAFAQSLSLEVDPAKRETLAKERDAQLVESQRQTGKDLKDLSLAQSADARAVLAARLDQELEFAKIASDVRLRSMDSDEARLNAARDAGLVSLGDYQDRSIAILRDKLAEKTGLIGAEITAEERRPKTDAQATLASATKVAGLRAQKGGLSDEFKVSELAVITKARAEYLAGRDRELDQIAQTLDGLRKEADAREQELATYGLSGSALEAVTRKREDEAAAAKRSIAVREAEVNTTSAQAYLDQADAIDRAAAARRALARVVEREAQDPMTGAQKGVEDYLKGIADAGKATQDAVTGAMKGMEDGLTEFIATGKFNFKGLVDSIIAEVVRLSVVRPLMQAAFGGSGGSGGTNWAWLIGTAASMLSGSYNANYGNEGLNYPAPVGGKASGGPVSAGRTYLVGERGPELLRMGAHGGSVVPNGQSGQGGGPVVNVTQNISVGAGVNASQLAQAMDRAKEQAKAEIHDQMRRGSRAYS